MTDSVQGLEKERDFYFNKLRDIEILIQQVLDANPAAATIEGGILTQIQDIMYSTEEGFEVPTQDPSSTVTATDQDAVGGSTAEDALAVADDSTYATGLDTDLDNLHLGHANHHNHHQEDPDEVF